MMPIHPLQGARGADEGPELVEVVSPQGASLASGVEPVKGSESVEACKCGRVLGTVKQVTEYLMAGRKPGSFRYLKCGVCGNVRMGSDAGVRWLNRKERRGYEGMMRAGKLRKDF